MGGGGGGGGGSLFHHTLSICWQGGTVWLITRWRCWIEGSANSSKPLPLSSQAVHLVTRWHCVVDHHVTLRWLVEQRVLHWALSPCLFLHKLSIRSPDGTVQLITMWRCLDRFNIGFHSELFPYELLIWSPGGTGLTGWMEGSVQSTESLPLSSQAFDPTVMWYIVDWWNRGFWRIFVALKPHHVFLVTESLAQSIVSSSLCISLVRGAAHLFWKRWIACVTVFNSSVAWAAALCLRVGLKCAEFPCIQPVIWLPVLGLFNMRTGVNACGCMWQWVYKHCKRVCTESWLGGEKIC